MVTNKTAEKEWFLKYLFGQFTVAVSGPISCTSLAKWKMPGSKSYINNKQLSERRKNAEGPNEVPPLLSYWTNIFSS